MKNDYFEKREIDCQERLNNIIKDLPYYVEDFFIGIENRCSVLTRLNYAYDLRVFYIFLTKKIYRTKDIVQIELSDLASLQASDIEYFLSYLNHHEVNGKMERCTETGKARKLSTLRAFYKFFFNKNLLPANTPTKVSMPKIHEKEIIRLDTNENVDEVGDMLYVVETGNGLTKKQKKFHDATKVRDCAIITLFLGTGIRISELVGLNVNDIFLDNNSFVVTRKGGNRTILYYTDEVKLELVKWLDARSKIEGLPKDEPALFLSLQNKRISVRAVQELVKKYAKIVSPLKRITPHKLRSTFGTKLYRETGDIYVVADYLGHRDINTTKRHYAAMSEDMRKKAIKTISLKNNEET